jgi:acetyl esterase/lipase
MVRHQNLLVTIAILWLAAIILAVRMQMHQSTAHKNLAKHILFNSHNSCMTIAYGPHLSNEANLLDLWLPEEGESRKTLTPIIVFIHGGAWESGDKSYMSYQAPFNNAGYAVASINYRLTREASFPAQIEDCKIAIGWLRSHAKALRLDPDHIGVWGVSAGGHLAALLGTTADTTNHSWESPTDVSSSVQAVCDWCGPTDLTTISQQAGSSYVLSHAVRQLLGGTPEEKPEMAKDASPVAYVHKDCPPFLIVHGQSDSIVPLEQSRELALRLKEVKSSYIFEIIKRGSHNFADKNTIDRVVQFFDLALKK